MTSYSQLGHIVTSLAKDCLHIGQRCLPNFSSAICSQFMAMRYKKTIPNTSPTNPPRTAPKRAKRELTLRPRNRPRKSNPRTGTIIMKLATIKYRIFSPLEGRQPVVKVYTFFCCRLSLLSAFTPLSFDDIRNEGIPLDLWGSLEDTPGIGFFQFW